MTTGIDVTDAPTDATAAVPAAPRRRYGLVAVLVPWVLAVSLAAVAAVALLQWQSLRTAEADRDDVRLVAVEVLGHLTGWDAADGLDDTRAALRALADGDFAAEIDELFGGSIAADLTAVGARSEGTVEDVFVQSIEGDVAEVFAVVTQSTATTDPVTSAQQVQRAALTLQRVDGRWRAVKVELTQDVAVPDEEAP